MISTVPVSPPPGEVGGVEQRSARDAGMLLRRLAAGGQLVVPTFPFLLRPESEFPG